MLLEQSMEQEFRDLESQGPQHGIWMKEARAERVDVWTVLKLCIGTSLAVHWLSGDGNGTPLQYSCLENPMDGGGWWATVHGVTKSWTQLSDVTFTFHFHALEKEMAPTTVFLPGESQGRGAWRAAIYGVAQSRTRLK